MWIDTVHYGHQLYWFPQPEGASGSGSGSTSEPGVGVQDSSTSRRAGREEPTETHMIVRQWGAEVTVAVLPPSFDPPDRKAKKAAEGAEAAETNRKARNESKGVSAESSLSGTPIPSPFASEGSEPRANGHPNVRANGHSNDRTAGADVIGDEEAAARETLKKLHTWRNTGLGKKVPALLPYLQVPKAAYNVKATFSTL